MSTKKEKPVSKFPHHKGRPKGAPRGSNYDPDFHPAKLFELTKKGMVEAEICKYFNIHVSTFHNWCHRHPEFKRAKLEGRRLIDDTVEAALYKKAVGYTKGGKWYPGDTTAMIFWLKNRRPKDWRDRKELKFEGEIKTVSDIKKLTDEQLMMYLMDPDEYQVHPLPEEIEEADDDENKVN